MKIRLIVAAGCVLSGTASAQNLTISVMSRAVGSAEWATNTNAGPGAVVEVGIFMSGDASVYGMGGATLRLTATGGMGETAVFAAGTSTGRVAPFSFGAATNQIYANADGFRIDAASDAGNSNASAGMTFFQRDPSSGGGSFSQANPALVFRFDVHSEGRPEMRELTMTLDQLARDVGSYYASANDTRPRLAAVTLVAGTIRYGVPTPGTIGVLAAAGVFATRRRGR